MTDQHMKKAQAVADKLVSKVSDTLSGLELEMKLMKWPAEYRAIMWDAVAAEASKRAQDARP